MRKDTEDKQSRYNEYRYKNCGHIKDINGMSGSKRRRKAALPVMLAAILCIIQAPVKAAEENVLTKEEVVYSLLASDGQVKEIYVVNAFHLPQSAVLTDYGEYSLLENLTDTGAIQYEGNKITLDAEKGRFYYQGNMVSKELPWNIRVTYTLDDKAVKAEVLAGSSGKAGIQILTAPNPKTDKIFYEKYMLQVTVTLDTSICQNIQAEDAVLANAGTDKQITFTVMPGTEGRMEVLADADTFAMKGISIAAVPFSAGADMPDTADIGQLTEGLNQLSKGIMDLNGGAGQLKSGAAALEYGTSELKNGTDEFNEGILRLKEGAGSISGGAALLESGSGEFESGLNQAASASDGLLAGSGQINEAMQLLKAGAAQLGGLDLTQLQMLPGGLGSLAAGLEEMQAGYGGLFQALDAAMSANPVGGISEAELYAAQQELAGASPETQEVFGKLAENYTSAMTIAGTYNGIRQSYEQLQEGLALLIQNIRGMAGQLEVMKSADPDGLKNLADGLGSLADQYAGFHEGLSEYMSGIKALSGGYSEIEGGIRSLAEGTSNLYGGISQTADGASSLVNGAGSLSSGAKELSDGVGQLADGLEILNEKTRTMPQQIQESIDGMIGKYTNTDFTPVSFVSSRNQNVESVQFVLSTEGIEAVKAAEKEAEKVKEESVWERFKKLFK